MNKKGFTLIEVIVSVVLVSVVMVSLLSSLIQLRQTYTVIHEDSDIIVYSSSISRIINNDLIDNNGIRYITCNIEKTKCDMILGNDKKRVLEIDKEEIDDLNYDQATKKVVKTTLRYIDTTDNEKKLVYIRTLELERYEKNGKVTTRGYNFLDINPEQKEYNNPGNHMIDTYTTVTIRIYNGVDEEVSKYNIKLYTAGRYDYSHMVGKLFTIELNSNGADVVGARQIDEVFGVGFFEAETNHSASDRIDSIEIPKKGTLAFLGYFYKKNGIETVIVDSTGKITVTNKFFKENVKVPDYSQLNPEEQIQVYAKWGECSAGYEVKDGGCYPKNCTVKYDLNGGTMMGTYTGNNLRKVDNVPAYDVLYNQWLPTLNGYTKTPIEIPVKGGHEFGGFKYGSTVVYHTPDGVGQTRNLYYNDNGDGGTCPIVIKAEWTPCNPGYYSLETDLTCSICTENSYTPESGTEKCLACGETSETAGYRNDAKGQSGCLDKCGNSYQVAVWKQAKWNDGSNGTTVNTVDYICIIQACYGGYAIENNKCEITNPTTPTISAASEKIYGSTDTTLTCTVSNASTYVTGTNLYYSFGYSSDDGGTPSNWTTPTTSKTYTVGKSSYGASEFDRYYSCRVYSKDDSSTTGAQQSETITSKPENDVRVRYNNAKITFDATSNSGTLSDSNLENLYTRTGKNKLYGGIRNTTTKNAPQAKRAGYGFNGWYTEASGGSKVIAADGTIQASVSGWTNSSKNFIITSDKTLYAQFSVCGKGKYNNGDYALCQSCPDAQYQNETGKTSCKACPSGYNHSDGGREANTNCYIVVLGGQYKTSSTGTGVDNCSSGYYKAQHNSYYNSADSCETCPSGYSYSNGGRDEKHDCYRNVAAGKRVATAGGGVSDCPAGTHRDTNTTVHYGDTLSCDLCPGGTYSYDTGATSSAWCHACPAGSKSKDDRTGCDVCPAGTYSPSIGQATCTACPTDSCSIGNSVSCSVKYKCVRSDSLVTPSSPSAAYRYYTYNQDGTHCPPLHTTGSGKYYHVFKYYGGTCN